MGHSCQSQMDKTGPGREGWVDILIQTDFSGGTWHFFKAGSKTFWKAQLWADDPAWVLGQRWLLSCGEGTPLITKSHLMYKWENQRLFGIITPKEKYLQFIEPWKIVWNHLFSRIASNSVHQVRRQILPASNIKAELFHKQLEAFPPNFMSAQLETSLLSVIILSIKACPKTFLVVSLPYKFGGDAFPLATVLTA